MFNKQSLEEKGLTRLCPQLPVVAHVILASTTSVIAGGVGFPARLAVSFFATFVCCRHFPSHVWDNMCPDVNENPRAFGPSSTWVTDGTVHNNCLTIKRNSVDDLFLSFQHIFSYLLK